MITTVSAGLVAVMIMFIEQAIVAASISPHLEETERPRATPASVISKAVPRGGDAARGARGQTKPANAARMPLNPPSLDQIDEHPVGHIDIGANGPFHLFLVTHPERIDRHLMLRVGGRVIA